MKVVERITFGGAIILSERLASHAVGNATWTLWRDTVGGASMGAWIKLEVVIGGRTLTWTEGAGLTRVDCPLEFLERSAKVDRDWRDRCWAWAESQIMPRGDEA